MKWQANIQLGRVLYNLGLPRDTSSLANQYLTSPFNPFVPLNQVVQFDATNSGIHNDEFIEQQCGDPDDTITNHRDGVVWATQAQIDLRNQVRDGQLITLDNLNIQRQHGVPEFGLTYNIDVGGMIDEYLIISRRPLYNNQTPANGVPKFLPALFGLNAGWNIGEMDDILFAERRRYQPDSRFVATQPLNSSTTYGDLGPAPPISPEDSTTFRYPSLTLADVESWGNTALPIQGPTLYIYRYVDMFAADRSAQILGTVGKYPENSPFDAIAQNFVYLEMNLQVRFPSVYITLTGTQYEGSLGELAIAYQRDLMTGPGLLRDKPDPRDQTPPEYRPAPDGEA